ncbi:dihydrolipoyl dehydrogenase [Sulfurisphaera ohwakuensis]|uniref:dihydrolipoyl dehydrogenase n=1 Tax=Sulfurisphaera ohwakuensis TaxID=69656 RepID=UPI0036F36C7D
MKYDVTVIGAGGGGYPGAFRLAKSGYNVLMADPKGELGGNCLYSGCVPSKTVREMAQLIWRTSRVLNQEIKVDFERIQDHKDFVQETRFKQHKRELSEYSSITFYKGVIKIKDPNHVIVKTEDKEIEAETRYIIIASGSEPFKPQFPGSEYCITSDDLYSYKTPLRKLPQDMVIIGGGYIAIETASIFNILGVKTHLLVRGDRVLRGFEDEIVNTLLPILKLDIIYNAPILEVKKIKEDEFEVIYSSKDGAKKSIRTNLVLLATGRKPVLPEGIENTGIALDKRGYIVIDNAMRTNLPNVFATGDVNGKAPYFHAAVRMSIAAAYNIMANGSPIDYVDYKSIPVTIYSVPSASYVGIMPSEAKRMGIEIMEATYNMEDEVMAQMYDEREGMLKLIFEKGSLRLIGAWMVGVHSQYLINELGQAVLHGLTAKQLASFADQHPSTNEIIAYAARKVL